MILTEQLLALADTLAAEGAVKAAKALQEAVELLDERDELLDLVDDLTQQLKEEQTAHRNTQAMTTELDRAIAQLFVSLPDEVMRSQIDNVQRHRRQDRFIKDDLIYSQQYYALARPSAQSALKLSDVVTLS